MNRLSSFKTRDSLLKSLNQIDSDYPIPKVLKILQSAENYHLLRYVAEDPFGAHVFPGNIKSYPPQKFLSDVNTELLNSPPTHLWITLPLCRYRCHYCQFPTLIISNDSRQATKQTRLWIDAVIKETQLWLSNLPNLKKAPIGELNIFGGTPTLFPAEELERLIAFVKKNFNFIDSTTMRIEGSPDTLTYDKLKFLFDLGFRKLSFGVQTFNDNILKLCNRLHSSDQAIEAYKNARKIGFTRINGDLIYGMIDQTVKDFRNDVQQMITLGFTQIIITKLHLRSFAETRTAISGIGTAPWQNSSYRQKLAEEGHRWPALGEQYQMREEAVKLLHDNDYYEKPDMYFQKIGDESERWKSIVMDQDKQRIEIGIGLGGSSGCSRSEASNKVHPLNYLKLVNEGKIPLSHVTGFNSLGRERRSVRMALASCQPLRDDLHRKRSPKSSLFSSPWKELFASMQRRGLVTVDPSEKVVALTEEGKTLVEAIINTEIKD